jgi:TolA-binding protein
MKREDITAFELNLARNSRATASAREIAALSLEERTERLIALKENIQEGTASLFEEKVLTKLLVGRAAERILEIEKLLPGLEEEIKKRAIPKRSSTSLPETPPAAAPAKARSSMSGQYPSELLEFLASQKPPTPPPGKPSPKQQSSRVPSDEAKKPSAWRLKDVGVGIGLMLLVAIALWYSIASQQPETVPLTFDQQAAGDATPSGLSNEELDQMQTTFDEGMQALRFGDFEQGKMQLLTFVQMYPTTSLARDAYMAIADTCRQRKNDPDEALRYYQLFLNQYPESQQIGLVQLKMGYAYEDLEDTGSAQGMYQLILQSNGRESRVGQLANERLQALKP